MVLIGLILIISAILLGIHLIQKRVNFKKRSIARAMSAMIIVFIMVLGTACAGNSSTSDKKVGSKKNTEQTKSSKNTEESKVKEADTTQASGVSGQLKVSYIDVGQADSILIQQGSSSMLIDAGNNGDSETVKSYISSQGITKLDFVVGTHPHEDHIGGLDYVINNFQIGKIYMPKATSTTKTFQDVITAIKNKGMQISEPTVGETFKVGEANCTILGPINSKNDDLNTYSIVIKVVFGNNKFLFTGDAQDSSEQDMINKGFDLSADVLKVGHHGSHTSTSQAFLDKVNPKYAVISVGKGNDYGHPHQEVMTRLQAKNIPVYRTDENGTIVATSDGTNIKFNTNAGSYKYNGTGSSSTSTSSTTNTPAPSKAPIITTAAPSENQSVTVYTTNTGSKYHLDGCSSLSKSKIPISLSDAKSKGLTPCSKCNPPQ